MAQKIVLVDDIDGKGADETVHFSLDGTSYEIDLSAKNAKEFRAAFARYIEVARPLRKTNGAARNLKPSNSPRAVREWAKAQGLKVPSTGRIPKAVEEQYAAAMG